MKYEKRGFLDSSVYSDVGNEIDHEARRAIREIFKKFPNCCPRDVSHIICRSATEIESETMIRNAVGFTKKRINGDFSG